MADIIVGYATDQTVMSNDGGLIRVTFGPWELDREFFAAINVGHWIANVTLAGPAGNGVAIIAKGGTEDIGYWFTINLPWGTAGWANGNRCSPQRQVVMNNQLTVAASMLVMAMNDTFLMWYSNANNSRAWLENIFFQDIAGSVWGMLSRRQIQIASNNVAQINFWGNLAAQNQQAVVQNITIGTGGNNQLGLLYMPTAGQEGAGLRGTRCSEYGDNIAFCVGQALPATCQFDHCHAQMATVGFEVFGGGGSVEMYFNTAALCGTGFELGDAGEIVRNCLAFECGLGFNGIGNVLPNVTFNAETGATLPVDPTNLSGMNRNQIRVWFDNAHGFFGRDFRILGVNSPIPSVLVGAGVAVAGLGTDCDGNPHADPPSIGWHEGTPAAFLGWVPELVCCHHHVIAGQHAEIR